MTLYHRGCGGVLRPEGHPRWSIAKLIDPTGSLVMAPVVTAGLETLHRCSRCGLVGVEVEPVTLAPVADSGETPSVGPGPVSPEGARR